MKLSDCSASTPESLAELAAIATWIQGREYLRITQPAEIPAWDASWGVGTASRVPTGTPDWQKVKAENPKLHAFIFDTANQIVAVPGWFPGLDTASCAMSWRVFTCTMSEYARSPQAAIAVMVAAKHEAPATSCAQWKVGDDPAYSGLPSGPSGEKKSSTIWWVLGIGTAAVIGASVFWDYRGLGR